MIQVTDFTGDTTELYFFGKYTRYNGFIERWAVLYPPFDCQYRAIPLPIFTEWWPE